MRCCSRNPPPAVHPMSGGGSDLFYGVAMGLGAVLLAAFALFRRRLRIRLSSSMRRSLQSGILGLRRLQSGCVGDYVLWLTCSGFWRPFCHLIAVRSQTWKVPRQVAPLQHSYRQWLAIGAGVLWGGGIWSKRAPAWGLAGLARTPASVERETTCQCPCFSLSV